MPEDFCRHYDQLRKAAKFVAKNCKEPQPGAVDGEAEAATRESTGELRPAGEAAPATAPAPGAGTPRASVASTPAGAATLRVCTKCIRRLAKKGVAFDPLSTLERISGDHISIEPTSCLKYCRYGPNVEVEIDSVGPGVAAIVDGMTEEEIERRLFQGVSNRSAAARVVGLVRVKLGGDRDQAAEAKGGEQTDFHPGEVSTPIARPVAGEQPESLQFAAVGVPSKENPPADPERVRRARVRANVRDRLERIIAGIDEDDL